MLCGIQLLAEAVYPPDDSPGSSTGGSERSFHVSSRPRRSEDDWLWCGFASTFGQTRSGTRNTHASVHDLPVFRALCGSLVCCPQARLRTFPGNDIPGTRGDGICCWIEIGRQKRRVQVALYRPNAAWALMPALPERLGGDLP